MLTLADVYQIIVRQAYGSTKVDNVFYYNTVDSGGSAADLRDAFLTTMAPAIRQLQASFFTWQSIDTMSLGNEADFEKYPVTLAGLAGSGDVLPIFNAVGFTLNPVTRAVRPGSKRIAGLLEAVVTEGVITEPTFVANVEALRIKFDDVLVGSDASYQPVIVKRKKTLIAGTVPPQYKYELPKAGDPLVLGLVKSATSNLKVTSQVSRKK